MLKIMIFFFSTIFLIRNLEDLWCLHNTFQRKQAPCRVLVAMLSELVPSWLQMAALHPNHCWISANKKGMSKTEKDISQMSWPP